MHATGTLEYDTMSKSELISRIREVNRSARPEFLAGFSEGELVGYLERLKDVDRAGETDDQPLLFD